jgi:hypothetical protein
MDFFDKALGVPPSGKPVFADSAKMVGKLKIEINGEVVQEIDNLVVTAGKNFVASRMVGTASAIMSHMAVGAGATAAANGDTALGSELGRVALTSGVAAAAVVTYIATFPAGTATGAITEAGILNSGAGGTMLCRTVFGVVNKGASDSMTITWTVTVG